MAQAMTLVGLDVHARQTHAAILIRETGEVRGCRLRLTPEEVVSFLGSLAAPVLAVYEAGPTGFGLARAAIQGGIDVRVVAPGSIPKSLGDRVKTDKRDGACTSTQEGSAPSREARAAYYGQPAAAGRARS